MRRGRYRHACALDTDLIVYAVYPATHGLKVSGSLVNRHNGEVYEIKSYFIKQSELKMWERIDDETRRKNGEVPHGTASAL